MPPSSRDKRGGNSTNSDQRRGKGGRADAQIRRRNCYFCREKIDEVDYKNAAQLRRYISEKGKIRSRRITGRVPPSPAAARGRDQARAGDGAPALRVRLAMATKIILLTDVENLGLRGDVVDVASGYARNYLLPRRMAESATPAKVAELERREAHRARHDASTADQARDLAAKLEALELRFDVNAGPTGTLFGSITPTDLAERIREESEHPHRPAQGRTWPSRSSASAGTRSRSRSSRT